MSLKKFAKEDFINKYTDSCEFCGGRVIPDRELVCVDCASVQSEQIFDEKNYSASNKLECINRIHEMYLYNNSVRFRFISSKPYAERTIETAVHFKYNKRMISEIKSLPRDFPYFFKDAEEISDYLNFIKEHHFFVKVNGARGVGKLPNYIKYRRFFILELFKNLRGETCLFEIRDSTVKLTGKTFKLLRNLKTYMNYVYDFIKFDYLHTYRFSLLRIYIDYLCEKSNTSTLRVENYIRVAESLLEDVHAINIHAEMIFSIATRVLFTALNCSSSRFEKYCKKIGIPLHSRRMQRLHAI